MTLYLARHESHLSIYDFAGAKMRQDVLAEHIYQSYNENHPAYKKAKNTGVPQGDIASKRRFIKLYFPPSLQSKILEVGCGSGSLIQMAERQGYTKIYGVESSRSQVLQANRNGILPVEDDAIRHLGNLQSGCLDCIIAYDVIEHLSDEMLLQFAQESVRVLSPSGTLIAHVPNGGSLVGLQILFSDMTHKRAFTSSSIGQLFHSCGYREVVCYNDPPVVYSLKSFLRRVCWRLVIEFFNVLLALETGVSSKNILSANIIFKAQK